MGNSASNAANPNRAQASATRNPSTSPKPGETHPSLRTKKKSLELPDLASLMLTSAQQNQRGRQTTKTASIPIPTAPQSPFNHYQQAQGNTGVQQRPRNLPSTSDISSSSNLFASSRIPSAVPSAPRGRQQPISNKQQQAQVTRLQELYNSSQQHPPAPPSSPADAGLAPDASHGRGKYQEVVKSSIPVALPKALAQDAQEAVAEEVEPITEDPLADPVPVKIVWKGGGTTVHLARAGDDEWKGRHPMEQEGPNTWTATIMLRPGTHHVRFLVDDQWRVADDLPTAVDDQGSLANYVAVPISFGVPAVASPVPAPPQPRKLQPGQSFWSADSSADGEETDHKPHTASHGHTHSHSLHHVVSQAKWTNILPPELIEASRQEEEYLAASAGHFESSTSSTRVTGFVPAPNIPPAPSLPRHLDKLILNTKVAGNTSGNTSSHGGSSNAGVGPSGVGSGQASSGRRRDREKDREHRDREHRDRERGERERERRGARRPNIPPPPPPSEDGTGDGESEVVRPSTSTDGPGITPSGSGNTSTTHSSSASTPVASNVNTATTTPQTSLPATPTAPLSPTQSPPRGWTSTSVPANVNTLSAEVYPQPPPLQERVSGSRTITLDMATMPPLTDDMSVLPVPSHVVLHHLSTSAIRNGVLAVGNTTRYRKKYLTTIYYKPT